MLKKYWWKALSVIILIYVFIAGMTVPLSPGIERVAPTSVRTGDEVTLEVLGYNSRYDEGGKVSAWLKLDNERASRQNQCRWKAGAG